MQNVEIVVNAAKKLQNRSDIVFLIIGEGARRAEIEKMVNTLENVLMLPMQPSRIAPHIYSAAGVNLIPLVAGGTKTALPSKTGVVLSCGKPAIFTFGKESYFSNILKKFNAGKSVDPNDADQLAESICEVVSDADKYDNTGIYELFKRYFSQKSNVLKYVDELKK